MLSRSLFFFFNDTATTEIYTLSLHDALPISGCARRAPAVCRRGPSSGRGAGKRTRASPAMADQALRLGRPGTGAGRNGVETRWRAAVARAHRACVISDV